MTLSININIEGKADIFSFRRNVHAFISQIVESTQYPSAIASELSEISKAIFSETGPFYINIQFDRNTLSKSIFLNFIELSNSPKMIELLNEFNLNVLQSELKEPFISAEKKYSLPQLLVDLPTDDMLSEILAAKSREKLFSEIDQQKKDLQNILDHSPACIGFRVGHIYRYVNDAYKTQFNLDVGSDIKDLYVSRDELESVQAELASSGAVVDKSVIFKKGNGEHRQCILTVLPTTYKGEQGNMLWVTDVTENKAAEQAILIAKNAAEEATLAKSNFLANMSHEIRTPMNAIIGMSYLALKGNLDKKEKNYIEKVHQAGENLLGIINDILDFSKIEAGKMSIEETEFFLDKVLDNTTNFVIAKAQEKGLELLFKIDNSIPLSFIGDPLRIGQILTNLISNAIKFTERGHIIIAVEKMTESIEEIELNFKVIDSGIGMTKAQCEKLFQSFSQADASTTRKYGGTGLGLVISKSLVEEMGGRIWVESEVGKGTTFQFYISLKKNQNNSPSHLLNMDDMNDLRVLIVDDNPIAIEITASIALSLGMNVTIARGGKEAIELTLQQMEKDPFQLILMDWQMPELNGIEVAKKLSGVPNSPPIIIVTAFGRSDVSSIVNSSQTNIKTIITKPIFKSTLFDAISSSLLHKDMSTSAESNSEDKQTTWKNKLNGLNILLVEDNEMNQELAYELLSGVGIQVTIANNGSEALDKLSKNSEFDGVLMDCQMPVMDGFTATTEIRKIPHFAKMPIIAMTANASIEDREKVIAVGMCDHIPKPINIDQMFDTIIKWIKPNQNIIPVEASNEPKPKVESKSLPSQLEGIDIVAGLSRTMNNENLYLRLLNKFYISQSNFTSDFLNALNQSDLDTATRLAHTLKGNAGNIGATGVQHAASMLEESCLKNTEDLSHILESNEKVSREMQVVIASLSKLCSDQDVNKESSAPIQTKLAGERLKRLRELLEESDADAYEYMEEFLKENLDPLLLSELKLILSYVESYDFDAALDKLNKIQNY